MKDKKDKNVNIRLTREELDNIKERAKESGYKSTSAFIRICSLNGRIENIFNSKIDNYIGI